MIRIIDKGTDEFGTVFVIQKVIAPKSGKTIRYQTVPLERKRGDEVLIKYHDTLGQARHRIGKANSDGKPIAVGN